MGFPFRLLDLPGAHCYARGAAARCHNADAGYFCVDCTSGSRSHANVLLRAECRRTRSERRLGSLLHGGAFSCTCRKKHVMYDTESFLHLCRTEGVNTSSITSQPGWKRPPGSAFAGTPHLSSVLPDEINLSLIPRVGRCEGRFSGCFCGCFVSLSSRWAQRHSDGFTSNLETPGESWWFLSFHFGLEFNFLHSGCRNAAAVKSLFQT